MFSLLKKVGWIGGLVELARTPQGQRALAKARAYATDPKTRRKLGELRTKIAATTTDNCRPHPHPKEHSCTF